MLGIDLFVSLADSRATQKLIICHKTCERKLLKPKKSFQLSSVKKKKMSETTNDGCEGFTPELSAVLQGELDDKKKENGSESDDSSDHLQ